MKIKKNKTILILTFFVLYGCFERNNRTIIKGSVKVELEQLLIKAITTSDLKFAKLVIDKIAEKKDIKKFLNEFFVPIKNRDQEIDISLLAFSIESAGLNLNGEKYKNAMDIIKLLLDNGADPNVVLTNPNLKGEPCYFNPIIYLLRLTVPENFKIEILEEFALHGADFNKVYAQKDGSTAFTALMSALINDHIRVSRFLINHGADVNFVIKNTFDSSGSLLYIFTAQKSVNAVKFLLDCNAKIILPDKIYFLIIQFFHPEIFNRPNIAITEKERLELTSHVSQSFDYLSITLKKYNLEERWEQIKETIDRRFVSTFIEGLLRQDEEICGILDLLYSMPTKHSTASISEKSRGNFHAIARIKFFYIFNYFWDIFGLDLARKEEFLKITDIDGLTALHVAANEKNYLFFHKHLTLQNILYKDPNGINCFTYFMERFDEKEIKKFLELLNRLSDGDKSKLYEAANESDIKGYTILHRLVHSGSTQKIKMLFDSGIKMDLSKESEKGKTAFMWAKERGNKEIIRLFQKYSRN